MKEKFTELAGYSPDEASDVGIRMRVLAEEVCSLGQAIDWLKEQTFAQSATGKQLEYRAMERGVTRKPASPAVGTLTFSRKTSLWYAVPIPAGTVCATSGVDAVRYVTTEDAELPLGELSVEVPAKAETPGTAGNTDEGTITVLVTPPASIEAVTNKEAFIGGQDAEDDESLRARLMDCWAEPANGANAAWYRQLAESFDGVNSAQVVPLENGAGTVTVYLAGEGETAADEVVQQVQEVFDEQRELCTEVTVKPAVEVPVNVTCKIKVKAGQNAIAAKMYTTIALREYFNKLGVGEPVVISAMTAEIFAQGLVDDCTFTTPGKTVGAGELATVGILVVAEDK
jgi:uncharacterized phage protein gp47/JayE